MSLNINGLLIITTIDVIIGLNFTTQAIQYAMPATLKVQRSAPRPDWNVT